MRAYPTHMRRNKYRAKRTEVDGITFDSAKEAKRYAELKLMERAGQISRLELQPVYKLVIDGRPVVMRSERYPNGRQVKYVGDFAYFQDGKRIVEDVKGVRTPLYNLKKACVEAMYPGVRIVEV